MRCLLRGSFLTYTILQREHLNLSPVCSAMSLFKPLLSGIVSHRHHNKYWPLFTIHKMSEDRKKFTEQKTHRMLSGKSTVSSYPIPKADFKYLLTGTPVFQGVGSLLPTAILKRSDKASFQAALAENNFFVSTTAFPESVSLTKT